MLLLVSGLVAYLLIGYSYAVGNLSGPALSRPMWSSNPNLGMIPTLGMIILYIILWPITQVFQRHSRTKREVVFSLLMSVLQTVLITGLVWCCISLSIYVFKNTVIEVIVSAVFLVIGIRFVLPFVNLAAIPILMLILLPLNLLFPESGPKGKMNKEGE